MKTPRWGGAGKGPMRVTWMQVWADLLAAGVDRNTIDKQPNALLVGLMEATENTAAVYQEWEEIWAVQLKDCTAPKDVPLEVKSDGSLCGGIV